ncbi:MAG: hypothetical protein KAR45_22490, partial [Desulfobacteraceae bacterium]|nr:hypothetical protein [Desulfobacteraceae bacterium]
MINWFRSSVLLFIITTLVFFSTQAYAFIPEGTDIIKLAVKAIVEPRGIIVAQKRKIYYEQRVLENLEEAGETEKVEEVEEVGEIEESGRLIKEENIIEENIVEQGETELLFTEITEKLMFSFPDKFRSEAVTGNHDMICVES